jgi:glycosyltransferase involved in cell wall biosynthesis
MSNDPNPDVPPIRVLYIDHIARLSGGEIALLRLIGSLNRRLVTPIVCLAGDGPLVEKLRALDVDVHILPLTSTVREIRKDTMTAGALGRIGPALQLMAYSFRVARLVRTTGAQIVHTNSLKSDLYGGLAATLARRPFVWHVRDHIDPSYLPTAAVHAFRFLAQRWPTYVVANSQSTLDRLFLNPRRNLSAVVPSGVVMKRSVVHDGLGKQQPPDIIEADSIVANHTWHEIPRIGLVGRLTSWKGQHIFLEAARQVLAAGYDARFLLAGSAMFGEEAYEQSLHEQVAAARIDDKVEFLGFEKDIPRFLQTLDLLVHASTTPEPFGQVVIEGMAEGLPVIGTDGGGVREIIVDGENGLLVPMGDADAMFRAIRRLLDDRDAARRLGRAGYLRVFRHFTAEHTARKVERVYQEIAERCGLS